MATVVIKKDKTEEPFDVEKLKQSIRINAIDATLKETEQKIKDLVEQVSNAILQAIEGKEKVTAEELREKILNELDGAAPDVAKIWREFDQQQEKI